MSTPTKSEREARWAWYGRVFALGLPLNFGSAWPLTVLVSGRSWEWALPTAFGSAVGYWFSMLLLGWVAFR